MPSPTSAARLSFREVAGEKHNAEHSYILETWPTLQVPMGGG